MINKVDRVIAAVTGATMEIYEAGDDFKGGLPEDEATRVATLVHLMLGVIEKASTDPDFPVIVAAVAIDRLMQADEGRVE